MGIARGPNVINDGLIFGYDTGYGVADNETGTRFYPGEPTTNEFYNTGSAGNILDHASGYGGYGTVQSGALDAFGTTNCNVYRNTGKIRLGPTGGQDIGTLTNGNTYTWSIYLKHVAGQTESTSMEFDIADRADSYSFSGTLGSNMTYEWKRFSVTALHNNSTNYHFLDLGTHQGTNVFDWCMPQIDVGSHATPHTKTSRSDTASLIDLKRTRNIDLSSSSFTSTGQPTFDGTSDSVSLGDDAAFDFVTGVATIEAVVKFPSSWTGGSQYPNLISKGGSAGWDTAGWALYGFRDWPSGTSTKSWGFAMRNGSTVRNVARNGVATDKYVHIVATMDDTTIRLYENGVAQGTISQTINPEANTSNVYIGRGPSSQYFPGDIPVAKIYDRALTAAEIKQNYNSYKNRFNL